MSKKKKKLAKLVSYFFLIYEPWTDNINKEK